MLTETGDTGKNQSRQGQRRVDFEPEKGKKKQQPKQPEKMVPRPVANNKPYQAFLAGLSPGTLETSLEQLIHLIKLRQIDPPHGYAFATVRYLAQAINCTSNDPTALLARVKKDGKQLIDANPKLVVVANIVRRVLGIIRDEIDSLVKEGQLPPGVLGGSSTPRFVPDIPSPLRRSETESGEVTGAMSRASSNKSKAHASAQFAAPAVSMFDLLAYPEQNVSPQPTSPHTEPVRQKDLKSEILSATNEFMDELGQADDQIASYALDHIHANEVVLTYGASETVQAFLLKAASKRKFTVINVECYPNHHTEAHKYATGANTGDDSTVAMKKSLTGLGIEVVVVPDSNIYALMSRVNKVILPTHAVMVNGGVVGDAGTGLIAQAARVHKIPVLVLSAVYKLSPVYPFDTEGLVEYGDPAALLRPEDMHLLGRAVVVNPLTEYVAPEQIDLYITNLGAHAPSYLNRIIQDHYGSEVDM